jgi:hypothetical protein
MPELKPRLFPPRGVASVPALPKPEKVADAPDLAAPAAEAKPH